MFPTVEGTEQRRVIDTEGETCSVETGEMDGYAGLECNPINADNLRTINESQKYNSEF